MHRWQKNLKKKKRRRKNGEKPHIYNIVGHRWRRWLTYSYPLLPLRFVDEFVAAAARAKKNIPLLCSTARKGISQSKMLSLIVSPLSMQTMDVE